MNRNERFAPNADGLKDFEEYLVDTYFRRDYEVNLTESELIRNNYTPYNEEYFRR